MQTIVGLFDDLGAAHAAVQALRDLGLPSSDVSLVAHDATGAYSQSLTASAAPATDATAAGAGMGAVLGGLAGMVVGLGALVLPGIGPVLAAGPLATVLAGILGAGVGAVGGGMAGGLIGALIDLGVPEDQAQYYAEGLRRGGALVTARVADQQAGPVRELLSHHAIDVEQRVQTWRAQGWSGYDPTTQPYSGEQVAAERRAAGPAPDPTMNAEDYYRQHFAGEYSTTGRDYDAYRPAYQYGQALTTDPRYSEWEWERVEPEAQRDWETRYPHHAWGDFKAAVRVAWESVKATIR